MKENIQNQILKRLSELGYTVVPEDYTSIAVCTEKAKAYFSLICKNTMDKRLLPYFTDHVCGLFLKEKLAFKKIPANFSPEQSAASVKIGDTSISFRDLTKDMSAEKAVSALLCPKEVLSCFRKMTW